MSGLVSFFITTVKQSSQHDIIIIYRRLLAFPRSLSLYWGDVVVVAAWF
jgi:hypothetical protein